MLLVQNDLAALKAIEGQHNVDTNAKVDNLAEQMKQAMIDFRTLQLAVTTQAGSATGKSNRLDFQAAKDISPTTAWAGLDDKKVHWKEWCEEILNYATALYKGSKELMDEVERLPEEDEVDLMLLTAGEADTNELFNSTIYGMLYKRTADTARKVITSAGRGNGLQAWHDLCHYARPVSVSDEHTEYFKILNPARAKDEKDLGLTLNVWVSKVAEFEKRYTSIEERSKKVGLLALVPKETYDKRLLGTTEDLPFKELLVKVKAIARDRTIVNGGKAVSFGGAAPMDLDTVAKDKEEEEKKAQEAAGLKAITAQVEELNALMRGKGGKGGNKGDKNGGKAYDRYNKGGSAQSYGPWYPGKANQADEAKGGGKGKAGTGGKGGKAGKGGNKTLICHTCGGVGHPARLCPTHQELGEEGGEEQPEEEEYADDFFELAEQEETVQLTTSPPLPHQAETTEEERPEEEVPLTTSPLPHKETTTTTTHQDDHDHDHDHDHDITRTTTTTNDVARTTTTSPGSAQMGNVVSLLGERTYAKDDYNNGDMGYKSLQNSVPITEGRWNKRDNTANKGWVHNKTQAKTVQNPGAKILGNAGTRVLQNGPYGTVGKMVRELECNGRDGTTKECEYNCKTHGSATQNSIGRNLGNGGVRVSQNLQYGMVGKVLSNETEGTNSTVGTGADGMSAAKQKPEVWQSWKQWGSKKRHRGTNSQLRSTQRRDFFTGLHFFGERAPEEEDSPAGLYGLDDAMPRRKGKWIKITAVADSGAVVSVMPDHLIPFIKVKPSAESKAGKQYRGAGGEPIPVIGEKRVQMTTAEGQKKTTTWRICPVKRPLLSIAQIISTGHKVTLDQDNPRIENVRSGQITKLRPKGKVFELDLWIEVPEGFDENGMDVDTVASSFTRQEA